MKKVWLKRIHLSMNGETIGFCPQTCLIKNHAMQKYIVLLKRFEWSLYWISSTDPVVHTCTLYYMQQIIVPHKDTAEEVPVIEWPHHTILSTGTKVTTTVTNWVILIVLGGRTAEEVWFKW